MIEMIYIYDIKKLKKKKEEWSIKKLKKKKKEWSPLSVDECALWRHDLMDLGFHYYGSVGWVGTMVVNLFTRREATTFVIPPMH